MTTVRWNTGVLVFNLVLGAVRTMSGDRLAAAMHAVAGLVALWALDHFDAPASSSRAVRRCRRPPLAVNEPREETDRGSEAETSP